VSQVFLPRTFEELWDFLKEHPSAAIYAGGTDLLVTMRAGRIKPDSLICIERLDDLKGVKDHGREIFIGAATTHSRLIEAQSIGQQFPVLIKAVSTLGSPPIRHMGTIGGNIVTASPAGDTLPALYTLSAEVELRSFDGSRRLPIRSFIIGPGEVDLASGEVLAGVWLPKDEGWNVSHYEKVGRRKAQACAVASMAAVLELSDSGTIRRARLAWGSVGPTVVTSDELENTLVGERLAVETLKRAGDLLETAISPIDDIRASAEYRRMVSKELLLRLTQYYGRSTH
jgi:CO/xanthine dehydrogenase FAD-binding subunit